MEKYQTGILVKNEIILLKRSYEINDTKMFIIYRFFVLVTSKVLGNGHIIDKFFEHKVLLCSLDQIAKSRFP